MYAFCERWSGLFIGVPLARKDYKIIYDFMSFYGLRNCSGFRIQKKNKTNPPKRKQKITKKREKSTKHSSTMNSLKFLKKLLAPHEKK